MGSVFSRTLWSRALLLLNVRTRAALDAAEDPREVMEFAYGQQVALARRVRRGLVEVTTARRQLEIQIERARERVRNAETQAKEALAADREDLATRALEGKHQILVEIEALERRAEEVRKDEAQVRVALERLGARVDAFRARRTMVSARYAAYGAHAHAEEALLGLTDEVLDLAVIRAEDNTDHLQARATALEVAVETLGPTALDGMGGIGDSVGSAADALDRELRAVVSQNAIARELATLKREVSAQPRHGSEMQSQTATPPGHAASDTPEHTATQGEEDAHDSSTR